MRKIFSVSISNIPALLAGLFIYAVTCILSYFFLVPFVVNTMPLDGIANRWLLLHANQPIAALISGFILAPFYTNTVSMLFAASIAIVCHHFQLSDVYRSNLSNQVVDPLLVFALMQVGHYSGRLVFRKREPCPASCPSPPPTLTSDQQQSLSNRETPRTRPFFKPLGSALLGLFCWAVIYWGPIGIINKGDFRLTRPANMLETPGADMSEYVEVRKLDLAIYTPSKGFFNRALWKNFANNPHEKAFERVTTEKWQEKQKCYEMKLVEKARLAGLDFQSLERSLRAIRNDLAGGVATIPVAAYLVRNNWREAWIIPCKWEYPGQISASDGKKVYLSVGHIAVWAVRASNQKILGFTTCK